MRTFHVDPTQSKAAYIVNEELFAGATSKYGLAIGKSQVIGETQDVVGLLQLDLSGSAIGANRFAVYLPTLRTDQKLRDGWISPERVAVGHGSPWRNSSPLRSLVGPKTTGRAKAARFQLAGELTLRRHHLAYRMGPVGQPARRQDQRARRNPLADDRPRLRSAQLCQHTHR